MKNLKILRNFFNITQKELSIKIAVEEQTINRYENGKISPPLKTIIKICDVFQISIDYLLIAEECLYPRNLKLLRLASKLDNYFQSDKRNYIETTAKSLLNNIENIDNRITQDSPELKLSNNFQNNLKYIRNIREMTQLELAEIINVTRPNLGMYESKQDPPIDKLLPLSNALKVSVHSLATGELLFFNFGDKYFGEAILKADKYLSLTNQNILITLMESILKPKPVTA